MWKLWRYIAYPLFINNNYKWFWCEKLFDVLEKITSLREDRNRQTWNYMPDLWYYSGRILKWYRCSGFHDWRRKKYVVTVESADSCSENGCDKYYRSATVLWLNLPWTIAIWTSIFFFFQIFLKCSFIVHYTPCSCLFHSLAVYVCILKITKFCYLHENKRAFHNSLRVSA